MQRKTRASTTRASTTWAPRDCTARLSLCLASVLLRLPPYHTRLQVRLEGNLEVLFSDTVGFIQKLPTQLVAAFRATLEEIAAASVVVHVLDISAPNAAAQCSAVLQVGRLVVGCGIVPAWVGVHARTHGRVR